MTFGTQAAGKLSAELGRQMMAQSRAGRQPPASKSKGRSKLAGRKHKVRNRRSR